MKLHIASDLHIDFGDLELPGGDCLILAGDMCEARTFGRNDGGLARTLAKRVKRFCQEELTKYKYVFYVPGNHEYYGRSIDEANELLKLNLPKNVEFLLGGMRQFHDIPLTIIGVTLWTDVGGDSPAGHAHLKRCMSDFSVITDFSTHNMYYRHKEDLKVLTNMLKATTIEGSELKDNVLVMTHHAPSQQSVHERYKEDIYMNMGYYSNLEQLILDNPHIKLWVHGHMHDPFDYMVGSTRVVCNPRGYYGYEPRAKYYKVLEIEV